MHIIFLGPPGSGKGTQAALIKKEFGIPHISTGDILREEIKNDSELGKKAKTFIDEGKLVPDDLIIDIIKERISEDDCREGFIFDGFPRTIEQAQALSEITDITHVINVKSSDENIIERISTRLTCPKCNNVYGKADPPKEKGICDNCGEKLIQRDDQNPDVVKKRLEVYHEQTEPLIRYYEKKGILTDINGEQLIEAVTRDILRVLRK